MFCVKVVLKHYIRRYCMETLRFLLETWRSHYRDFIRDMKTYLEAWRISLEKF